MIFKRITLTLFAAFAGSVASAAPSATQPAERKVAESQPAPRAEGLRFPGMFPGGGGGGPRPPRFLASRYDEKPTDQQVKDAETFVSANSPNHFKFYQRTAENPGFHERMQYSVVHGYLDLQILQNDDPDLYRMKLEQIRLQDKVYGLVMAARASGTDRQKLREELRPIEREIVAKRKEEAAHRLDRMQRALDGERQRLDALQKLDATGLDALAEQDIDAGLSSGSSNPNRGPNPR